MLGFQQPGWSRREWLRVGGIELGALGLSGLTGLAAGAGTGVAGGSRRDGRAGVKVGAGAEVAPRVAGSFGRAKSVIVIFLGGGPPQHETWDPKPEAPEEIRGGFGTISTRTPGLEIGELMPRTAELTDKIAVLRAMVTGDNAHSSSGYHMMTGVPHVPPSSENAVSKAPNLAPHWGAANKYVRREERLGIPPAITIPNRIANVGEVVWPGQTGGILGPKYDPWLLTCDPSQAGFNVPDLSLPSEIPAGRLQKRLSLLEQLHPHLDGVDGSAAAADFGRQSEQALELLVGSGVRRAFDLSLESEATRDRYGRTRWAQSVLLARRLVEAGVSLIQVNWCRVDGEPNGGGWDTHDRHNDLLKRFLMPWMDQAYSALLSDLAERGLLDETLVLWVGEFGHTPKFNARAGRDHWGHCFSVALAGGGVRGGVVHGRSDGQAAFPLAGRVEPRDLHATMFHCLGFLPETEVLDAQGRPHPLSRGRVIEEIL